MFGQKYLEIQTDNQVRLNKNSFLPEVLFEIIDFIQAFWITSFYFLPELVCSQSFKST